MAKIERENASLKRKVRYIQLAFVATVLSGTMVCLAGSNAQENGPTLVKATGFLLYDRSGKLRATLGCNERNQATRLRIFGDDGQRADFGIDVGVAELSLSGKDNKIGVKVASGKDAKGFMLVSDGAAGLRNVLLP